MACKQSDKGTIFFWNGGIFHIKKCEVTIQCVRSVSAKSLPQAMPIVGIR